MPEQPEKEITRRGFMTKFGQGLVVAHVAGAAEGSLGATTAGGPDPPGKKLGWAPCLAWAI